MASWRSLETAPKNEQGSGVRKGTAGAGAQGLLGDLGREQRVEVRAGRHVGAILQCPRAPVGCCVFSSRGRVR